MLKGGSEGVTGTYRAEPSRGIPSTHRVCGAPPAPRRRRSGAVRRRKGLQQRLHHLKDLLAALPVAGPDFAYKPVKIRPGLGAWVVPEGCGGPGGSLGSSIRANSQNRARPGISGISRDGTKFLKDALQLMEDFRTRLAFWTVTLPDSDYSYFADGTASWPLFQRRVCDLVSRHLRAEGVEALVVAAVEIGDKRARRTRRPMPHIHLVLNGWNARDRRGRYVLSPKVCDQLVSQAAKYAGLPSRQRPAMSSVEPIRKSVHNYMSKYLTKQAGIGEVDLSGGWDECIPRQWWNASEEARALVDGCLFKLSPGFAAFLVQRQVQLENAGLGKAGTVVVGYRKSITGDFPIEFTRFTFKNTEALHAAIEWFCLWCSNSETPIKAGPPDVP